jgi:hypothetical protein
MHADMKIKRLLGANEIGINYLQSLAKISAEATTRTAMALLI